MRADCVPLVSKRLGAECISKLDIIVLGFNCEVLNYRKLKLMLIVREYNCMERGGRLQYHKYINRFGRLQ